MPFVLASPMAPVIVGLALMLLVWAIQTLLVRPLVQLLEHVPLVGGTVASAIGDIVGTVIGWATDWAGKAVGPLVELIAVPVSNLVSFVTMLVQAVEAIGQTALQAASWAYGAVGTLADRIASLLAQVTGLSAALGAVRTLISSIQAAIAHVTAHVIPDAINAVRSWAVSLVGSAINTLRTALVGLIDQARAYAAALVAAATSTLTKAIDAVRAWVLAAVAVALRPIQAELDGLGRAIDQAIGAVRVQLGQLQGLMPLLSIVPLVAAIPLTISQFWRTKNECVDPTCSLLGSVLDGLGDVGELLTGSVLVYLVSRSIEDPEGTAQEVAGWGDELRGLASGVTQVIAGRSI